MIPYEDSFNEVIEREIENVPKRTTAEILKDALNEAKELEKIEKKKNKNQDKAGRYTMEALVEEFSCSEGTIKNILNGKKILTKEEITRWEEYLPFGNGCLDQDSDRYRRKENMKGIRDIENEDIQYRNQEIETYNKEAAEQVQKIEEWFNELDLEKCCKLAHYIEYYKIIDDNCWMFLLKYFQLNSEGKKSIEASIDEMTIPVAEVTKEQRIGKYLIMMNLTDKMIKEQLIADKKEAGMAGMGSQKREEILRNEYFRKINPSLEYQKVAYKTVEDIYKRFWGYFKMEKKDWKIMIKFMLLGRIGSVSHVHTGYPMTVFQSAKYYETLELIRCQKSKKRKKLVAKNIIWS